MGWTNQNVIARLVIIEGPDGGQFIYDGQPAAGNLIYSITNGSQQDPFKLNLTPAGGAISYANLSGTYLALQHAAGGFQWWTAASESGPWTSVMSLGAGFLNSGDPVLSLEGNPFAGLRLNGSFAFVSPSGDATGATDYANITAELIGGGDVFLLPGVYHIDQPLLIGTQQTLAGAGPNAIIEAVAAFSGSYMIQLADPATTVQAGVRDLVLWGGAPNASSDLTGPGGIQLDNTGLTTSGDLPGGIGDSLHLLENVLVMNSGGDAFHFDNHVRELRCINCKAERTQGYGFYIGDAGGAGSGCTDSHFTDCTSGFSLNHGFNVLNSNNMFQGCKAFEAGNNFYTGQSGTTECGFEINGPQANILTFTNCQAQQNALHGFDLQSCVDVAIVGCQADSNGSGPSVSTGVGINVNGATGCVITGNVGKQQLTPGNQIWGVQAAGGCKGTVIRDNPITGTSGTFTSSASNLNRGTATLSGGTVTVSNTSVTSASMILLTVVSPGGTPGAVYVSAISAGASFTITSTSALDTSTVAWEIVY